MKKTKHTAVDEYELTWQELAAGRQELSVAANLRQAFVPAIGPLGSESNFNLPAKHLALMVLTHIQTRLLLQRFII